MRVKLEQIPTIDKIVAMIEYTEARIATETNPLGIHLLEHHLSVYNRMGDMILNNVIERQE